MFYNIIKNNMFVWILCCNLLLFKLVVFQVSVLGVAAFNEQQHQEVHRLKSELSELLENDNTDVANRGTIIQPSWTQLSSEKADSVKVEVNAKNRNEAAVLRAEIEQAVSKDSYANSAFTKTQDIKSLEESLKSKEKDRESLPSTESKQIQPIAPEEQHLAARQQELFRASNVITENLDVYSNIDPRKLQRLQVSKRRTREMLILKYIEEDYSFDLGAEVKAWKHIMHTAQEYFIGRRTSDLLLVLKEGDNYKIAMTLDIGQVISDMETYTYWNSEQEQHEYIILVVTANKILWYRANSETKSIELYWEWVVGNIIAGLTHFALDSNNFLTISSNSSFLSGHYALNIYQFKLESKEFWIAQRLQLNYPCEEVTILDSGRDIILAIPQNNTAQIYTFNPHEADLSHIHFVLKRSIVAEGISVIAGFKMGGHCYLALTGYQPQILLYQQSDFISKTILAGNFGLVELFFPIPVRTYRDDLILLVQHKVDFSTHSLTVVETLIWNGETFEISIPVPCHLGEHVVYGVGCMLDLHRNEGLKGAALVNTGDEVSVIVPRYKVQSGLFHFHTELLAKNSELLDLQEIFEFLKDWVKEQDDLIAEAEAFLKIPHDQLLNFKPDAMVIESLKTPQFEFNGEVSEIQVNGHKWSADDSNSDFNLIIQNLEDLERSLNYGRQRRNLDELQQDYLDFDEVAVEDLEVENVNGLPYFIQNGELNFDGLINLDELQVLEKLSNTQERLLNAEDLPFNVNLEFDQINGVNWSDIKNNLVFKTQNQDLKELEVKGEVLIENVLTINTLNTLNFPDDYLLANGPATSTVTAEKHFASSLSVGTVDINGLVNGKNPLDAITLSEPQQWQGMAIFKQLEIAEVLELHGQVHGGDEKKPSPIATLQNSKTITATCHFNEIIINGPIVLKGELDGKSLGTLLKDIILKPESPEDELIIPSSKSFNTISFPTDFELENNTINEIPISDFVTQHTNQTLNLTYIEGLIYFYNLTVNGTFDGVVIEDILKEVILLDQPIDLSSTELVFPEKLKASSVTILDTINKHPINGNLQTLQEDLQIEAAEFESVHTLLAEFANDILGQGKLNNMELHSFLNERAWPESAMRGNLFLNELILEKGIKADELHGIEAESLLDFLNQIDELHNMTLSGQIQVGHMIVTGDIQLHKLNGLLFDEEIQSTAIKLQHPNFLSTNLSFRNRLVIRGQLNVMGDFRGKNLPNLIDDIVLRTTNSCIAITASKSFKQPVKVLQNTEIEAVNGISMSNIAWKTKSNIFSGSVLVKGNLVARNVNVKGNINDFNWQDLQNLLYFDENLQNFVLKNTIEFDKQLNLDDLTVMGDLQSVKNLADFFKHLIRKNQMCMLNGKNTFTGRISIDRGASIRYLNGQDLSNLFNNLVFIHDVEPVVIHSPISFKGPIYANQMEIRKSLITEYLNGCSLKEWINNTLRLDKNETVTDVLRFAAGSIDGNSLLVNFINDKDLSRIITLNTPQYFNLSVKFSEVILNGFIACKGLVNNVDIEEEYNNTLMIYGQQYISTPLNIETVTVLGDLNIRGLVNRDKDLKDVATLQEDLIFQSPLYFHSIYSPQVIFKNLVTGIDFNKWLESAIKNHYPAAQYITGNWSTKFLTVKTEPKVIQYVIKGLEPWQNYSFIRYTRTSRNTEGAAKDEICSLITQILQTLDRKPVFVKYIKEYFNMDFGQELKNKNESLHKLFHVQAEQENFLIVNLKCESFIYQWLIEENKFAFKTSFESGPINEIALMPAFNNSENLQFITSYETAENIDCSGSKGVKKWKVENGSIVLESHLPGSPELLYKTKANHTSLWTVGNETIQELDLDYKIKQKWQLPIAENKTRYRFVPLKSEHEILLTNGEQLLLIHNHSENKLPKSFLNTPDAKVQYSNFSNLQFNNSTATRSLVYADFKPVVERILIDLKQRLNQQVNITQLSIPESDLIDEHLIPDFLAIMNELQQQNIYDGKVINVSFNNIIIPADPSQILAARVVQIVWPVVVEIQKIHSYFMASNGSHDHSLYNCITKSLGFLINDVLLLANTANNSSNTESWKLNNIIERIREFEKDLEIFLQDYQNYYNNKPQVEKFVPYRIEESANKQDAKLRSQNYKVLRFEKKSFLPGSKQGEILSLEVGNVANPLHLWAVANTKVALAGNNPGIYIYLESVMGQLYQVISAKRPRSLQQLRIKQETLLLFVEECCQVRVLKYRGLQGFEAFAEVNSNGNIKQILTLSLPSFQGNLKYFLILLLENDVQFYEFVLEGYDFSLTSRAALIPSICL